MAQTEGAVMNPLLLWTAVPLMLLGASMPDAGLGSPGLWIAAVTVGIALVIIGRVKPGTAGRRRRSTQHYVQCLPKQPSPLTWAQASTLPPDVKPPVVPTQVRTLDLPPPAAMPLSWANSIRG